MKILKSFSFVALPLAFLVACNQMFEPRKKLDQHIFDSYILSIKNDTIKKVVDSILSRPYPFLNFNQPRFNKVGKGIKKASFEVVYKYSDTVGFMVKDSLLIVYGKNAETISRGLKKQKNNIYKQLEIQVKSRLFRYIYNDGFNVLNDSNWNVNFNIPKYFTQVRNTDDFIWWRIASKYDDHNICLVKSAPLKDSVQDNILQYLEESLSNIDFEPQTKEKNRVLIEKSNGISLQRIIRNDIFVYQIRGYWVKSPNANQGGPCLVRIYTNPENNEAFIWLGFLFKPGKPQKNDIRELEIISSTFQFNGNE